MAPWRLSTHFEYISCCWSGVRPPKNDGHELLLRKVAKMSVESACAAPTGADVLFNRKVHAGAAISDSISHVRGPVGPPSTHRQSLPAMVHVLHSKVPHASQRENAVPTHASKQLHRSTPGFGAASGMANAVGPWPPSPLLLSSSPSASHSMALCFFSSSSSSSSSESMIFLPALRFWFTLLPFAPSDDDDDGLKVCGESAVFLRAGVDDPMPPPWPASNTAGALVDLLGLFDMF